MTYAIGTSYPPTDIETVLSTTQLTGKRGPRSRFAEAGQFLDRLDANVSGQGYPVAVWSFDVLSQAMVNTLRGLCPGYSAAVYITTRTTDGTFMDYAAVMIWPQAQMDKRNFGGKYLGLEFQFRQLTPVYSLALAASANSQYIAVLKAAGVI